MHDICFTPYSCSPYKVLKEGRPPFLGRVQYRPPPSASTPSPQEAEDGGAEVATGEGGAGGGEAARRRGAEGDRAPSRRRDAPRAVWTSLRRVAADVCR